MQTNSSAPEGLVLRGLEPIVTGALHRFRALLPADIKLAVGYFCEDPRVRADADHLELALLSVFIIVWQSMAGTDYQLLASSGIDPSAQIKRIRPDLPTIIISGYVDEALKAKARERGALMVISKSRDLSELSLALRKVLWRTPSRAVSKNRL